MTGYRAGSYMKSCSLTRLFGNLSLGSDFRRTAAGKAVTQGMVTLREDGIRKAAEGLTSLEEVMKMVPGRLSPGRDMSTRFKYRARMGMDVWSKA